MTIVGSHAKSLTRRELRDFASYVRQACNLNDPYIDVEDLVEFRLPKVISGFHHTVEETEDMGDNLGLANPSENSIHLRKDVFYGMRGGNPQARITVLHEIGHVLLHKPEQIIFAKATRIPPKMNDPEWQADTFAAELAVPFFFLEGFNGNERELARQLGVPLEIVIQQLHHYRIAKRNP